MSKHLGYVFINLLNIDVIKHIFDFNKIKHNKICRICNKKITHNDPIIQNNNNSWNYCSKTCYNFT